MNQKERILRHIDDYGSITTMEAYNEYGITRLPSRVFELREMGFPIVGERETALNRYGEKVSYSRYRMEAGNAQPNY